MITRPVYKRIRVKMPGTHYVWPFPHGSYEFAYFSAWRDALRQCHEHEAVVAAMPIGGDAVALFSKGVDLARR